MAANKLIFYVDGTLLEEHAQIKQEDKLISRYWLDFLCCMKIPRRDPEKLTVISK